MGSVFKFVGKTSQGYFDLVSLRLCIDVCCAVFDAQVQGGFLA